jgi:DNA-binding IclR family transcriptional regulator
MADVGVRLLTKTGSGSTLKSLDRALDLLSILARSQGPLSVIDISKALKINRTTTYAMLNTLLAHKFIERDEETNRYTVGPMLFELGQMYRYRFAFTAIAEKQALALAHKWRLQVNVGIYNGDGNLLLILVQLPVVTPIIPLGYSVPAYASAMGKVVLAYLPDAEIAELLRSIELHKHTKHTKADKNALRQELTEIKVRGYATDREEYMEGLGCIAAPIYDRAGRTIASISVSGSVARILEDQEELIGEIVAVGKAISMDLGWRGLD